MEQRNVKPIEGYEGYYCVSIEGIVYSIDRKVNGRRVKGRIMRSKNNGSGYRFVVLSKNNKTEQFYVHRLVCNAFLENPEVKCCVNHKDGNPGNNSLENLEWNTHQENVQHGYSTGLNKNQKGGHWLATGVIDNSIGMEFGSIKEWCEFKGISYNTGRNYLNGSNKCRVIDLSDIVLTKKNRDNE